MNITDNFTQITQDHASNFSVFAETPSCLISEEELQFCQKNDIKKRCKTPDTPKVRFLSDGSFIIGGVSFKHFKVLEKEKLLIFKQKRWNVMYLLIPFETLPLCWSAQTQKFIVTT